MAKADLEMAVLKAQSSAPLTSTEMLELLDVDLGRLMLEFDLDRIQSEQVLMWRKHEALRWSHQVISFPEPIQESKKLSIRSLNKMIKESAGQGD